MINTFAKPNFFYAVVENRHDPLKLGRVQCRIVGVHTGQLSLDENTGEGLESLNLPWAYPATPITSASMNGIGETPLGPVEGSWIIGLTRDGETYNDLIYFATIGGIPEELPRSSEGFFDPNGKYPKPSFLNEPDMNRLARNESIEETIVEVKRKSVVTNVPIALGGTWNQPPVPYAANYPFNHVKESESGHISEVDDTVGSERIHNYHRTGTFEEIDNLGSKVTKIVKDNYSIILGDDYVEVDGNCHIHVNGDATLAVGGNMKAEVNGNVTTKTHGDEHHTIEGSLTRIVTGNITTITGGNENISVGANYDLNVGGKIVETASRIDLNP